MWRHECRKNLFNSKVSIYFNITSIKDM